MRNLIGKSLAVLAMAAVGAAAAPASGLVIDETLDIGFGAGGADGTTMDIKIEDIAANQVKVSFDLTNLFGGSFVSIIYLSYDGPAILDTDFGGRRRHLRSRIRIR